jgi:hypothetical protein
MIMLDYFSCFKNMKYKYVILELIVYILRERQRESEREKENSLANG